MMMKLEMRKDGMLKAGGNELLYVPAAGATTAVMISWCDY